MIESNSIIRASAGTGKTFALATRFIRQMMIDNIDPKTIVALTFSRAAAQEIYTKILMRLCAASANEEGANREWDTLLDDFRKQLVPDAANKLKWIESQQIAHSAADFGRLLRALVDTQHLGAIATIDSFILRIVKNFPKEMGFQNAVEVLDQVDETDALEDAVKSIMTKSGNAVEERNIAKVFIKAKGDVYSRTCLSAVTNILTNEGWRNFVIDHPESKEWTVDGMCAALGVSKESTMPNLDGLTYCEIKRKNAISFEEQFVNFAKSFDVKEGFANVSGKVLELMRHFWCNPEATTYQYTYYSIPCEFKAGVEGAAAIRGAIAHMMNLFLRYQLEIVKAKIDLVNAVESSYERMTRRAGKLTFADFTKFSAENEFSERGIAIQNVQFRFDSQFDHWALDEFQDTSELQWKCIRELVKNVADEGREGGGSSRSAMAVGDLKQSIYTWRGASARPFEQLANWESFSGCSRDFRVSHRYGPNIAAFVNKVFGTENIAHDGIIPESCYAAVDEWNAGWMDHISNEPADYVKVVAASLDDDPEADNEILPALHAELKTLWDRHGQEMSSDTVGILVRSNTEGRKVADYLRMKNLPIVWEGASTVCDLPVIEAVLALLKLGDHPEDMHAWRIVNDLFDVRKLLLPECTDAAAVSAAVSRLLTRQGLSRTLKDFCGTLREKGGLKQYGLTCERLKQLVEMGVEYEERNNRGNIDGFVKFLSDTKKREIAVSSDVIRILTIHRSKGLGIDHVFVPIFESDRSRSAIDKPTQKTPLYAGGEWVLGHVNYANLEFNDEMLAAYKSMCSTRFKESLRTYYVALTRSKKSLYVIAPDDSNPNAYGKGLLMQDLIFSAVGGSSYEMGTPPLLTKECREVEKRKDRDGWKIDGRREQIERCSPSHAFHAGWRIPSWMKASNLFDADFGEAARHGVDVHASYQKIEWADDETVAKLPEAFRVAFVKPTPDAIVWRERGYEIFDGNRWETGQFDRVVFYGENENRKAMIYDFKTNARHEGESSEDFAERMRSLYASQMEAYRNSLSKLTGLTTQRIEMQLLLVDDGQRVVV